LSLITHCVIIPPSAQLRLRRVARFASIERPALRKLKQLDFARRRPTGSSS
jgi:hypothetical protein